ncbi:hypothetical protein CDO30_20005 (plasmid) [Sinorhizobium meliloti]|nr:hypothetical protein CDO30_20005 [Sinorhizobium meliloti]ATA95226.1 hypothetical protein BWO76_01735 [Sinorhizobium meliloti]ATB00935.1 hypothetical protein BWO90_01660 [Sinorhizobium meliloti]RVO91535.1 hypothetical protein CN089_22815 [Sinorhizobium meliloti]RVQ19927.1 hypothetical protein CN096_07670 [Sinorhizobium meliloti]
MFSWVPLKSFVWCDDDRPEQFRAQRYEDHQRPAGLLPIAEPFGLLLGLNEGRSQSLIAHTPTPPSAH